MYVVGSGARSVPVAENASAVVVERNVIVAEIATDASGESIALVETWDIGLNIELAKSHEADVVVDKNRMRV